MYRTFCLSKQKLKTIGIHYCTIPSSMAQHIFLKSVLAVAPDRLVFQHLHRHETVMNLDGNYHNLDKNVYVIGFGKAVSGMCKAVQELAGEHLVSGVLSVPYGVTKDLKLHNQSHLLPLDDGKVEVIEGAFNNLPDENSLKATKKITELCKSISKEDLLIVLVSGGGSSLLPAPIPPVTMDDKLSLVKALTGKGATIQELNVVRQQLSLVKGRKLLKFIQPAKVWSLVLSDLIGDELGLVASGPTVRSNSTHADALRILKVYNVENIPSSVSTVLMTADNESYFQAHEVNHLVGSNLQALNAGLLEASKMGFASVALSRTLHGEARKLGYVLANLVVDIACYIKNGDPKITTIIKDSLNILDTLSCTPIEFESLKAALTSKNDFKGLCMIGAGETCVTFQTEPGKGGRNQEMVLAAAIQLYKRLKKTRLGDFAISILSAGTDGQDGPTTAAGAVINSSDIPTMDIGFAEQCLRNHDSFMFFENNGAVVTGLTGTNVMDIQILTVTKM